MEEQKASILSRKRPLELNIQDSPYYKMRALLKELRPHFIEVLKTPDFRNCKAASDIGEGMKLLMELYKEMMAEPIKLQKCSNVASSETHDDQKKPVEHQQDAAGSSSLNGTDDSIKGSYIIGGSALGWNFILLLGTKAVYYGRTKEDFRAKNPKSKSY